MHDALFEEEKKSLNDLQRQAVENINGPVMVIAGPGTGKTKILVLRIAEILKKTDTLPECILALTYTEAGATVMKQRLIQLIGSAGRKVRIETFHKFAISIQRDFPDYFADQEKKLITDGDKIIGFHAATKNLTLRTNVIDISNEYNQRKSVIILIEEMRRQGISADQFKKALDVFCAYTTEEQLILHKNSWTKKDRAKKMEKFLETNKDFSDIYIAYEDWIHKNHYFDFSSVILEVRDAIAQHEDLKYTLQENHQYLLIDEYQDTNMQQHQLAMQLADVFDRQPNLFIVGDRKQSIYGFQGASKEIFNEVIEEFPTTKIITLKENYRSAQNILDVAFSLADFKKESLVAKGSFEKSEVSFIAYKEEYEMLYDIHSSIKQLTENGVPYHEIGILTRNNKQLISVKDYLSKDFPVIHYGNDTFLENPTISLVIKMLWAVTHVMSVSEISLELLWSPFFEIPLYDSIKFTQYYACHKKDFEHKTFFEILSEEEIHSGAKISKAGILSLIAMNESLVMFKNLLVVDGVTSGIKEFLEQKKYFATNIKKEETVSVLERLFELFTLIQSLEQKHVREINPLCALSESLMMIKEYGLEIKKDKEPIPGSIALLTIHSSKGLEFKHVFIINVDKKTFNPVHRGLSIIPGVPHFVTHGFFKQAPETNESDNNNSLLFVAKTRAKEGLYISYVEGIGKKANIQTPELDTISIISKQFVMNEIDRQQTMLQAFYVHHGDYPTKQEFGNFLVWALKQKGISSSKLFEFEKNPWEFILTTILGMSSGDTFATIKGKLYHSIVEAIISTKKSGTEITYQEVEKITQKTLQKYQKDSPDFTINIKEVSDHCYIWWESFKSHDIDTVSIEVNMDTFEVDGLRLSGRIDILVETKHGIEIYDIKTSKIEKHIIKGEVEGKYKEQLLGYAAMVKNTKRYEGRPQLLTALYFITEPDADIQKLYDVVVPSNIETITSEKMKGIIESLLNLSFIEIPVGMDNHFKPIHIESVLKDFVENLQ